MNELLGYRIQAGMSISLRYCLGVHLGSPSSPRLLDAVDHRELHLYQSSVL